MEPVVLCLVLAFIALAVFVGIKHGRFVDESWAAAARRLNLQFQPSAFLQSRLIKGVVEGFRVTVDTYTTGSGKHRKTYTRFRLNYPSLRMGLKLSGAGFFSGVTKLFGAQDIEVGSSDFDALTLVKGADPNRVRAFLTPPRRMRIARFLRNHSGATVQDSEIYWAERGVISSTEQLVKTVERMVALAQHLTHDRADDRRLQRALIAQDAGRPEEALAVLREPDQEPTKNGNQKAATGLAEEQLLEGELLYLANRHEDAQAVFERAHELYPEDSEIREWAEHRSEQPSAGTSAIAAVDGDQTLDLAAICEQLFETQGASYRTTRLFDEHFAGESVRWQGRLERAERYSYDSVFEGAPGCKAIIIIHELSSITYGDRNVSAIVQFPAEAFEQLRRSTGQEVVFEGQLLKVDALLRNIYIAHGCLQE